ncbi:hypothetical protein ANN_15863 [Periplaneta americana]|uniref:Uncharacterized protein n=1 Tax=Periplaneta americana TaxID=6978 RepID=A0ABQ8SHD8_PERAM|nr:hypothetical protein ANN_15863 [Periplaneta americana]
MCDQLHAQIQSNPHEEKELTARLEIHQRKAEKAMTMMKQDHSESQKPSSVICTASIDLQQVLFVPTLTHSQMFYLRQLAVYNFGVHIADTNGAYMTLWHKGHSFLSCDRDFALIEKRKRVTKCIVPKNVKDMIQESRQVKPFTVSNMNESDSFDFKKAVDCNINTAKLNISEVQWLRLDKHKPHAVKIRRSLNEIEVWEVITILKKGVQVQNIKKMQLPVLDVTSHISGEKKKDLTEMI